MLRRCTTEWSTAVKSAALDGHRCATPQPLLGIQAARTLLSDPEGSPEQAGGLLEWWVAAWAAAASEGTLAMLARRWMAGAEDMGWELWDF